MLTDERQASGQPASPRSDDRALRAKAARRSWVCAGAGFALLGRAGLAVSTFIVSLATFGAVTWFAIEPGIAPVTAVVFTIAVATALWIGEQFAVKRVEPRVPSPGLLVGGYPFARIVYWLCAGIVFVILLMKFGSVQLAGSGMSPTLAKGERALYHRRVEPQRLSRGNVVLYRLSRHSAWGTPGWLIVSRILAVPGDRLSIQDGRYLVNGQAGPAVGATGQYTPVVQVPFSPAAVTVPENCYFVVQDDQANGFDSRVLSWVETSHMVSTRLYYLRRRSLLKAIE